ncbi:hypothetical protein LV89_00189 [Arcicella aurantiaca]|uniref:Uncharacterized protein n=1 Tax=Arcicella aurantiaca TaxID=591202 RepID=A0A316F158_9BACT|nr:hypothetical protein [Arcicella aurantiaca]PWK29349.1 hypothetical protein LV89_00189 [Arcicella aurantiaca]
MVFEQYLEQKNIDSEKFLWENPENFQELKIIFNQVSPESFTAQKKFLINKLRRKYQLKIY